MHAEGLDRPVEIATTFPCAGARLAGILHMPATPRGRGVVIVPGAPQYRVGSHRQFVLLARDLAAAGFPVLRFDYRGMGDSDGPFAGFEAVDEDIEAAVDHLLERAAELRGATLTDVVLWGLCDGASAIAFYARRDSRVGGIVLVNPWVRSEASIARTRVRHYYAGKLFSGDLWRRLARGEVDLARSLREFVSALGRAGSRDDGQGSEAPLPRRVGSAIEAFGGRVLILLSGADLTAQEFESAVLEPGAPWIARASVTVRRIADANHTYSTRAWRSEVHERTSEWLGEV